MKSIFKGNRKFRPLLHIISLERGNKFMANIYIVKDGDTLYGLSKSFNVPEGKIKRDNQLIGNELLVGQALIIQNKAIKQRVIVNGYAYPNISEEVLIKTLPNLTYLSVFSYHVTPTGDLISIDDEALINSALEQDVKAYLVVTNIGISGNFDSNLAHVILNSEKVQNDLISNIVIIMSKKKYFGLDIDFEYIYPVDLVLYNAFLKKVTEILHRNNFHVTTALAPKYSDTQSGLLYEAHDYYTHGQLSDHVIIMTYEWGYTYGPPMAVAPINQVEKILKYAVSVIPSYKIMMGIPNYGYDWVIPYKSGNKASTISNTAAIELAIQKKSEIKYDAVAQAPFFYYKDNLGSEHIVWFEDARSIQAKLSLVDKYNLSGISYWTIMNYFQQNWIILDLMYEIKKID